MSKETLQGIIDNFNLTDFETFLREKNSNISFPYSQIDLPDLDPNFTDGVKIAEGDIPLTGEAKTSDVKVIVCALKSANDLSERSSKKAQYSVGKKILRNMLVYAGIFIFYDAKGNFRFSLIYADYKNNKVDYSSFRRFTYFVSKEQTNKTFLMQIGDSDFTTLEGIKKAFSVDKVTKDFYKEIADWYFWAVKNVKIPPDAEREQGSKNVAIIRLITRIIFAWFIKVRGLIPQQLFQHADVLDILKDVSDNESTYYKAILQNLFFATLNTKMSDRDSVYKYDALFKDKEKAMSFFAEVPFLNGGLFECLDREEIVNGVPHQVFIDGFTEQDIGLSIPNYLFFSEGAKADLNEEYGTQNKEYNVSGLLNILSSYNFTVDENTPVDQEIALDPELLGKVFENLLASYNPETAMSARKATGSYYTPREIVDYMVRASLLEYFKEKLPSIPEEKLKLLLSDSEDIPELTNDEKRKLIESINHLKVLDPACGSGAFLMGVLQRLVNALQKIDPSNYYWCDQQIEDLMAMSQFIGKNVEDIKEAEEEKKEIKELFDESILYPDYTRKLYLIQNCIYGVDIQPIAIQISKLRFFISIVIDQKIDRTKENFGIRSLPNLETRFVAANTLIKLDDTQHLANAAIINLEEQLKNNRRRYFYAKTRIEKEKCKEKDKEIREKLVKELRKLGMDKGATDKIAEFDIFNQNKAADWFDPEWMFGVE